MAIRKIIKEGYPILRTKCRPVTVFDEKLHQLLDDMHETLDKAEGVGLAAPQVGYCRRFFIKHLGDIRIEAINPEIKRTAESSMCSKAAFLLPKIGAMSHARINVNSVLRIEMANGTK